MSTIFHIRVPAMRQSGCRAPIHRLNIRSAKTLCGQEPTRHDIRYSWLADPIGKYVPCLECLRIRSEMWNKQHASEGVVG
jgi:hypothetical protein